LCKKHSVIGKHGFHRMENITELLEGGDLRSLEKSSRLIPLISNQNDFDHLFLCLFHSDRKIAMRAADVIEKITAGTSNYLQPHKKKIFSLCRQAKDKELVWHLAQLLPRLTLTKAELKKVWNILSNWTLNFKESNIVRVTSLQSLNDLAKDNSEYYRALHNIVAHIRKENISSMNARIKKITDSGR
jgi:hypothetical protein